MDLIRFLVSGFFALGLSYCSVNAQGTRDNMAQSWGQTLKTISVAMPTNYGTLRGEIHYSEKDLAVALKAERIFKEDLIKVINYFEYVPHETVHFNIDPYMRLTNGNARTFPENIINLYNFPANNSEHLIVMENWMQGLMLHEFVHVVHLDQTRGYLETGRKIFGTIATLPTAIVPRWFTEGVAVWGESHLISGGRLNNPLFNKELWLQFNDHNFCKTIDCLDEPGIYPYGSLAYWAGAHFIEYLENFKPKSIKCLVEENSQALPFFLNNAFEKCLGDRAQNLFNKFRDDYQTREAPLSSPREDWGNKINNSFGVDDYQKGLVLDGDRLFKVEHRKKDESLVAYDLNHGVDFLKRYEFPIVDVSSITSTDRENRMLLVSFTEDPNFREHNKIWKLINPDTLLVERTLSFSHDPSYVIPLSDENFLAFSYWENKWMAEKNGHLLRSFSTDNNITMVKKLGENLLLKINDSRGTSFLVMADFKLEKLNVIYSSKAAYDLPLMTNNFLVVREGPNLKLLEWSNLEWNTNKVSMSTLPAALFNRVTFAVLNENRMIVLENNLKTSTSNIREIKSWLDKNKSKEEIAAITEFQMPAAPTESFASLRAESYPRIDHLMPHYWFLAADNSDNLANLGAMTTFVDPMEVHSLNATTLFYPDIGKIGGSFDYAHKFVQVSDQWKIRASFNQGYSQSDFSTQTNLDRDFVLKTDYAFLNKRWTYIPGLYGGQSTTKDFISSRSTYNAGISQNLIYQALVSDDFFQYLTTEFDLQTNTARFEKSYLGAQFTGKVGFALTDKLSAYCMGSYEKLLKSDFIRGVVYGGGTASYGKKRTHEFFGLPYGDAYGNEIVTARLAIDYNFWDIYRGKNLIPFYFKEAHLLVGGESLYADRIVLDGLIFKEKVINALFFGPRLKMNIFYHVPTNIDLIFSEIIQEGHSTNKVDFILTSDLF